MERTELANFDLFEGMTDAQLTESAALFEPITRVAGERITRVDDFGYSVFLVMEGRLQVEIDGENVAELGPGDHFGEVSLVTGKRRNATVIATEPCKLEKIMVWNFSQLLDKHPELAKRIKAVADSRS